MRFRMLRPAAAGLAALGLLVPPVAVSAAEPQRSPAPAAAVDFPQISDVALGAGGTLNGQVVDAVGSGVEGAVVTIRRGDVVAATAVSGRQGYFAIAGLQGGVVQVSAGQGIGVYRLWAAETAPPAAGNAALIVSDPTTIRGQNSRMGQVLRNPLVIAGIVTVAVAVPITVAQYRKDHKSGS